LAEPGRLHPRFAAAVSFVAALVAAVAQMPDFSAAAVARGGPQFVQSFLLVWLMIFHIPRRDAQYAAGMREQRQHHKAVLDRVVTRLDERDAQITALLTAGRPSPPPKP
jgi:hypothetical protein